MIEEQGQVVAVENGFAWVETRRRSTCESCSANKGCGTSVLSKVVGHRYSRIKALDPLGAEIGEAVIVALREDALLRGSLAVYLIPLLAMLVGAVLGDRLASNLVQDGDGLSILLGIAGLLTGFAWVARFGRRAQRDSRYQPVILRRSGRA